jgi:extradiol dioxygenase family protein
MGTLYESDLNRFLGKVTRHERFFYANQAVKPLEVASWRSMKPILKYLLNDHYFTTAK